MSYLGCLLQIRMELFLLFFPPLSWHFCLWLANRHSEESNPGPSPSSSTPSLPLPGCEGGRGHAWGRGGLGIRLSSSSTRSPSILSKILVLNPCFKVANYPKSWFHGHSCTVLPITTAVHRQLWWAASARLSGARLGDVGRIGCFFYIISGGYQEEPLALCLATGERLGVGTHAGRARAANLLKMMTCLLLSFGRGKGKRKWKTDDRQAPLLLLLQYMLTCGWDICRKYMESICMKYWLHLMIRFYSENNNAEVKISAEIGYFIFTKQ